MSTGPDWRASESGKFLLYHCPHANRRGRRACCHCDRVQQRRFFRQVRIRRRDYLSLDGTATSTSTVRCRRSTCSAARRSTRVRRRPFVATACREYFTTRTAPSCGSRRRAVMPAASFTSAWTWTMFAGCRRWPRSRGLVRARERGRSGLSADGREAERRPRSVKWEATRFVVSPPRAEPRPRSQQSVRRAAGQHPGLGAAAQRTRARRANRDRSPSRTAIDSLPDAAAVCWNDRRRGADVRPRDLVGHSMGSTAEPGTQNLEPARGALSPSRPSCLP